MYNEKQVAALRYYFLGAGLLNAHAALEVCLAQHTEVRKDGITPYYLHPIAVCSYLLTLSSSLMHVEDTLIAALCHDVLEDTNMKSADLLYHVKSEPAVIAVMLLSKNIGEEYRYMDDIASNPIASVVKPADRINNIQSMVGVFTKAKQEKYMEEVEHSILPAMKVSRRMFPSQQFVYENEKLVLQSQLRLIRSL